MEELSGIAIAEFDAETRLPSGGTGLTGNGLDGIEL